MIQIDGHTFRDLVVHMKMRLRPPLGFSLHLHTVFEYERMRCFVTRDGPLVQGGGFALTEHGEMVNLFSAKKGRGDDLVREAIALGAKKLDCYEGHLSDLYSSHGFKIVGREKWDDRFADPRWDKSLWGTPDIVFMELDQ